MGEDAIDVDGTATEGRAVRIVFDTRALNTTPEEHGEIVLEVGVARATTVGLAELLETFPVVEPGNPDRRVTPEDGEAYMRAFVACYRSSYSPAVLIEDELVSDEELRTLPMTTLVALIESGSSLRGDRAREALSILRGGPPDGVTY